MSFNADNGGFPFSCEDAKFSICASTWNTKLSQIGKITGAIRIMTHGLPNTGYIAKTLVKRPKNIFIIANADAESDARLIKSEFPEVRIALHARMNAKVVLVEPGTIWLSSCDFGETKSIESAVGFHSVDLHRRVVEQLFESEWKKSIEL
ncbi:MAG: hypothetical protein ACRYF7_23650 [Janthinobacterium lividum]